MPSAFAAPRLTWLERFVLTGAGAILVSLLATAAWLTPSPRGMGTHRQLGLPPCTIVAWYNVRCPSCGMTTSWSHMVRAQPLAACRANAGGALLALAAAVTGPWLLVSGARGKWLAGPPRETAILAIGLVIVTVTLIDWTLRLTFGR
jgi:hypothetical protein